MKVLRLLVLPCLALSGCSLFADRSSDAPVRMREKLEVPPDLSRSVAEDLSALPTASTAKSGGSGPAADPVVKEAVGVKSGSYAKLEREGSQRWLVVYATPEIVWDILRDYLERSQGGLTAENMRHGYLETDWKEQRFNLGKSALARALGSLHSTGLRDRFRVRIEAGRENATTEVMVSHIGLEEVVIGANVTGPNTMWQPRKSDPVLEADLLDRILVAVGAVDPVTRPVRVVEKEPVKRAARPKGPLLLAGETGDSAWRKVSQALDRAGVLIEDRDRGSGLLFVRFQEQSVKKSPGGMMAWLFGERKKNTDADDGTNRYQLRLKTDKNGVVVDVLNVEGKVDTLDPAPARLLDVLYEQLF